ncbi:MAG: polysaccharide biosynthesis C-terminal domain-containing protein [Pseudomonadota bacterium]|nr:polysaccharide biosynthesis C-terminal domain-containing protein [Pseudomonadota bacterium]
MNQNYWSVSILLVSSVLLAIVQTYFRTFRKMVGHSLLMLSHHFSEGILLVYLINGGEPLSSALWFLGWMRTTLMAVGLGFIIREIGFTWPQFSNLKDYLNYSIPLMPNALFYRLYDSADRFFLYSFFGSAAVGQYAAIYIAGSLLTTMVSPIHTVLLPTMAELWNQNRRNEIAHYIEQIIRFSALVILPLLLGMAALTEPLLKLLTQQQTDLEVDNFRIICMSFAVFGFGVPWGDLLAVAGKTRLLFTLNGVLAGMNFLLNLMLVPVYGIEGAVISTFVCHSTYTLVAYYKAQRVVPFSVPWKNMFLCLIAAISSTTTLYIALLMFSIMSSIIIAVAVYIVIISIIGALETSDLRFILGILGIK